MLPEIEVEFPTREQLLAMFERAEKLQRLLGEEISVVTCRRRRKMQEQLEAEEDHS